MRRRILAALGSEQYLTNEFACTTHKGPYINLDYIHTAKTSIVVDVNVLGYPEGSSSSNGPYTSIFGARKSNANYNAIQFICQLGGSSFGENVAFANRCCKEVNIAFNTGTRHKIILNTSSVSVDGTETILSGTPSSGYNPLLLFTANTASETGITPDTSGMGGFSKMRIWHLQILEDGIVAADCKPRVVDGVCGMYDSIRNRFFGSYDTAYAFSIGKGSK